MKKEFKVFVGHRCDGKFYDALLLLLSDISYGNLVIDTDNREVGSIIEFIKSFDLNCIDIRFRQIPSQGILLAYLYYENNRQREIRFKNVDYRRAEWV